MYPNPHHSHNSLLPLLTTLSILLPQTTAFVIPSPTATLTTSILPIPAAQAPIVTPPSVLYAYDKRGLLDDITSKAGDVAKSLGSVLGKDLPSYVISGIPQYFQDLPTGTQVLSRLGINEGDLAAKPTEVLNIPPYANWTDQGWNVRFHGNVYKTPDISQEKIDDLANVFLIDTEVKDLPPEGQAQARNMTKSIFIVQQSHQNLSFYLEPAPSQGSDGEEGGGGAVTPGGGQQNVTFPYETTAQGDFDAFVPILNVSGSGLEAGNETQAIQRLNVYTHGTLTGNATAFLVPTTGLTILSDIDDILRVTKIYQPKDGLLNSFAKPFVPWENMPEIYSNWAKTLNPTPHFHYLTTTPEQVTRMYMDFIYTHYPGGSFDTRPLNFSDVSATLSIRNYLLRRVFATFPDRKFVLVADTSNSDVMKAYPQLAHDFPEQVQCILLRNTSATDSGDWFPYDTKGFEGLSKDIYYFFKVPEDLRTLEFPQGGGCGGKRTIPQNVTFGVQDEVLGIKGAAARIGGARWNWGSALVGAVVVALVL